MFRRLFRSSLNLNFGNTDHLQEKIEVMIDKEIKKYKCNCNDREKNANGNEKEKENEEEKIYAILQDFFVNYH